MNTQFKGPWAVGRCPVVLGRLVLVDLLGVDWGRNVCGDGYREEVWRCIRNGRESLDAG